MSAATGSSTDPMVVYVQLLGEGTVVYRPAPAESLGANLVRLLMPEGYDPDDEDWEFKPGTTVRVEPRSLSEGEVLAAVSRVEEQDG
jgi:hypothetical protein